MCFSIAWLINILIWLIVIGAILAIVKLILPKILANFGDAGSTAMGIINILIWAVVMIAVVIFAGDIIVCLLSRMPRIA